MNIPMILAMVGVLLGIAIGYFVQSSPGFHPVACYVFNDKTQLWDRMRQP